MFMKYGKLNKGTEGYRSFSKLGQSSVTDFTVSAGTGTTYTYNNNWNVNDSFMQKKYRILVMVLNYVGVYLK